MAAEAVGNKFIRDLHGENVLIWGPSLIELRQRVTKQQTVPFSFLSVIRAYEDVKCSKRQPKQT